MSVHSHSEEHALITAQIPSGLRAELEQSARANDRSMSAEIRLALREHLASRSVVGSRPDELRTPPGAVEAQLVRDTEDGA